MDFRKIPIIGAVLGGFATLLWAIWRVCYARKPIPEQHQPDPGTVERVEDLAQRVQANNGTASTRLDIVTGELKRVERGTDGITRELIGMQSSIDKLADLNRRTESLIETIERQNGMAGK